MTVDKEKVAELIELYAKAHELAVTCGSEYIYQSDRAQEDALDLVADIFDEAVVI
jgi:hypothetical protein